MDYPEYNDFNFTDPLDYNYTFPDIPVTLFPEIQPIQIVSLVLYALVVLVGVPGNAIVVWVTGFCMQRSVTSIWFLNLALADLLCCLSLPLLMVPLAHDDHWHFGPLACTLVKGSFSLVMYCSVLQLVLISADRLLLVTRPVWCQNNRRPRAAAYGCVAVWILSLVASVPRFVYAREIAAGGHKRECVMAYTRRSVWPVTALRFVMAFIVPFLVIVGCHLVVYCRAERGMTRGRTRSKRTLRVIVAVILSFFLCWLPLHIVDCLLLATPADSPRRPHLYLAHVLAVCLAYANSCLNPLLYVCLGRGFKDSMSRSLRNVLHFISEEPGARTTVTHTHTHTDTKSTTSNGREMSKM
ncbi:C5a anaphylatoxin chemotactic receptor 1 [Salarias fasciatus]|uniref:C5a anaphylatoxin chemotactic receptor 1 n=1 Tax=Salarias fasciatus TaxID=181472 RepID=UPI001176E43F|nr:C5a anaphylatoxin chemotactic receptor 1 [Salarias fasciatus]